MRPNPPGRRTGQRVAVIGSGPAGLATADTLNHLGHEVTVFEKDRRLGGILRYGIPDFKLEKSVVVIGGGDTGSDCIGTSLRQGAKKVYQFEILPKPPTERPENTPWPICLNRLTEPLV